MIEHRGPQIAGNETDRLDADFNQPDQRLQLVFQPPEVGSSVTQGQPYAEIESVKAVSDVFAPLSGEVESVNSALSDRPET